MLVKAKRCEERAQKRDQVAKAAQCDLLKNKPSEAQTTTTNVPTIADKAVGVF